MQYYKLLNVNSFHLGCINPNLNVFNQPWVDFFSLILQHNTLDIMLSMFCEVKHMCFIAWTLVWEVSGIIFWWHLLVIEICNERNRIPPNSSYRQVTLLSKCPGSCALIQHFAEMLVQEIILLSLTHWAQTKWTACHRWHFQTYSLQWKYLNFK